MPSSDIARALTEEKFINFPLGTLTDVDKDADNVVATFIAPRNLKLKGVGVSWNTSDNSASGLTAKVTTTAGTVLASSGAGTPSATASGAYAEDADEFLSKGTIYCITIRSVADSNDFTAANVILCVESPKSDD